MWSTFTLSPIVEYLLMFRLYHVEKYLMPDNWRKIAVPERKLPRGFIVTTNYTMRGLLTNVTYEVKVAAVNKHGEGEWSKMIHFKLSMDGKKCRYFIFYQIISSFRIQSFHPPCQFSHPHSRPGKSVLPFSLYCQYITPATYACQPCSYGLLLSVTKTQQ